MSRTLSEIYTVTKEYRDKRLELTEIKNSSKMSILDAFTWVTSASIWVFENVMDVFKIDLAKDLQNRINGTPAYYANALLKYQTGDNLVVSEDGTKFSYATIDEKKRVVTKVAYSEETEEGFHDKLLLLKIATGQPGAYERIDDDELLAIRAYLNQILFAGQHALVVSRKGDVLIPRVTVYYDGAVTEEEVYANIEKALNDFTAKVDFNGVVFAQKIIDCIQSAEHVTDLEIVSDATNHQGIFVAQYNDDNHIIEVDGNKEIKVGRYFVPNSGYLKQSTKSGEEATFPTWKESIVLKLEDKR